MAKTNPVLMPAARLDRDVIYATGSILLGISRSEISNRSGLAEGTIDNIQKVLYETIGEDNVKHLRQTFQLSAKNIPPIGVATGYRISVKLDQFRIDDSELDSWLGDLYMSMKKHRIEANRLGDILALCHDLIKDDNASPRELPEKVKKLKDEYNKLRIKVPEERKNLEELQVAKKTEEASLVVILNEKKSEKELLADIRVSITESSGRLGQVQAELGHAEAKLAGIISKITMEQNGYDEYIKTRQLGFGAHQFRVIREKVTGIMRINGLDGANAVEKFIADVSSQYDAKLGFEQTLVKNKKECDNLQSQKLILQEDKKALEDDVRVLHSTRDDLVKNIAVLNEEVISIIARIKENLTDLPEIGKKIHDDLEKTREKILDAQQETVRSALPIEGLAPIGRAMSGEHVSMKSILASLDKIVEFLMTKISRNLTLYDSLLDIRKAIQDAAMFPPGDDFQT